MWAVVTHPYTTPLGGASHGHTSVLHLPQDDPEIVELHPEWLSTRDISHYFTNANVTTLSQEEIAPLYTVAARLYVFGEIVQGFPFSNIIIDETYNLVIQTKLLPLTTPTYIYDNTPDTAGY